MTRLMYDSVSAGKIPADAEMVAGYVSGKYAWSSADWNRFPKASHVSIDVFGVVVGADVLDVETGDATPAKAVAWIQERKKRGLGVGVIYCNRSNITAIFNAMAAAKLEVVRDFKTWIATLDGTKTVHDMTGVVAVQYENTPGWDASVVYDDSWKPTVKAPEVLKGVLVQLPNGIAKQVTSTDAGKTWR